VSDRRRNIRPDTRDDDGKYTRSPSRARNKATRTGRSSGLRAVVGLPDPGRRSGLLLQSGPAGSDTARATDADRPAGLEARGRGEDGSAWRGVNDASRSADRYESLREEPNFTGALSLWPNIHRWHARLDAAAVFARVLYYQQNGQDRSNFFFLQNEDVAPVYCTLLSSRPRINEPIDHTENDLRT
jgi:hypothetical protein